MKQSIGIDIGATNIKGVLINEQGEIIHQLTIPTAEMPDKYPEGQNWKQEVKSSLHQLLEFNTKEKISIGIAAPGIANKENTAIAYMPGRMIGIESFNWADYLNQKRIPVLNDAHAALIAECTLGESKGMQNVVMLTLGTGVGGAIWLEGKLFQGFLQRAGHLGHIPVQASDHFQSITNMPGSLEEAIGDVSIKRRSLGRYETTHELVNAYLAGDSFATMIWLNAVYQLSLGIAGIINAISPECILLGGGITKADHSLFGPLNRFLEVVEWRPKDFITPIKKAKFSSWAGAIGAACFAMNEET